MNYINKIDIILTMLTYKEKVVWTKVFYFPSRCLPSFLESESTEIYQSWNTTEIWNTPWRERGSLRYLIHIRWIWTIEIRFLGTQTLHTMFTSFLVSLHTKGKNMFTSSYNHFIIRAISYQKSLDTKSHLIPEVTILSCEYNRKLGFLTN